MKMTIKVMRRIKVVIMIVLFIKVRCFLVDESNRVGAAIVKKKSDRKFCISAKIEEAADGEDNYKAKRN